MRDLLLSLSCVATVGFVLMTHARDAPAGAGDGVVAVYALAETLAADDENRLVHLFAEDALVIADRTYRGRDEIRDWARSAVSAHARLEIYGCPAESMTTQGMLTWRGTLVASPGAHFPPVTAFAARLSDAGDPSSIGLLVIAPALSPITGGPDKQTGSVGCQALAPRPSQA